MVEEISENQIKEEDEDISNKSSISVQETQEEWEDILGSGSIMKKIVQHGKPDSRPQRLQNCEINYEIQLEDGVLVEKCNNFVMQLGDCDVS